MSWEILLLPFVATAAGFVGWFLQSRLEAIRRERERLHETRRAIYMKALDPYLRILTDAGAKKRLDSAIEQMMSYAHRRILFELVFLGSDDVVRSLNDLMQHCFHSKENRPKKTAEKLCQLFLAIRKDLGNDKTKLEPIETLRSQMRDIDEFMGIRA